MYYYDVNNHKCTQVPSAAEVYKVFNLAKEDASDVQYVQCEGQEGTINVGIPIGNQSVKDRLCPKDPQCPCDSVGGGLLPGSYNIVE